MTERINANDLDVWTADRGTEVGRVSLLLWTDAAKDSGDPALEVSMTIDETYALIRDLQQGAVDAASANAAHHWAAQDTRED